MRVRYPYFFVVFNRNLFLKSELEELDDTFIHCYTIRRQKEKEKEKQKQKQEVLYRCIEKIS
jgi:hypothetical protein